MMSDYEVTLVNDNSKYLMPPVHARSFTYGRATQGDRLTSSSVRLSSRWLLSPLTDWRLGKSSMSGS